ncbi:hypothetical protein DFAR_1670007 [Desulfarculales bacterium]
MLHYWGNSSNSTVNGEEPKNLGGAGDGGLTTCLDPELAAHLRSKRTRGFHPAEKYRYMHVGGNLRLDAVYDCLLSDSGLVDKGLVILPHQA